MSDELVGNDEAIDDPEVPKTKEKKQNTKKTGKKTSKKTAGAKKKTKH